VVDYLLFLIRGNFSEMDTVVLINDSFYLSSASLRLCVKLFYLCSLFDIQSRLQQMLNDRIGGYAVGFGAEVGDDAVS